MAHAQTADLRSRCDLLRSLQRPGAPLLLPNAWDVATAKAVVEAGFPVVATTSWGVAEALGYEDDERAPAEEMLWSKAFVMERERYDGADVIHLIRSKAEKLDWHRVLYAHVFRRP